MDKAVTQITQIKILPDHLINQIAAGEVVERPASVVKELLDNSLDAKASQVNIDIEQGGVGLIRVKDDGTGIPHDELGLALTRHATSKISQINDLHLLRTMGFRGEALPSIASISRLVITSKFIDAEHAWSLKAEGRMEPALPEPASHPQGTSIEVRDLFFNVPARRKYLRAERTEFYQIQQLVRHFAISHPELGVRLTHNGRQILNLRPVADNQSERVQAINGTRFMQNAIEIDANSKELFLRGWVGKGQAARTMNDSQFFCLNGRCIKDKRINHAIQQAYQGMLPEGRYATYALYLEIAPSMVDINVHPAKTEVRFRDGRSVHDFIYSSLNRELRESQFEISGLAPPIKFNNATVVQQKLISAKPTRPEPIISSAPQQAVQAFQPERVFTNRPNVVHERPTSYRAEVKLSNDSQLKVVAETTAFNQIGDVLLVKKEGELLLIDTKKVMVELISSFWVKTLQEGSIPLKALLFPHNIIADESSASLYRQNLSLLVELGVDIKESDSQGWQLRQLPATYSTSQFDEFISSLDEALRLGGAEPKESILAMMTLHYAENTVALEQKELLSQLEELDEVGLVRKLSENDLLTIIKGTTTSTDV